MYLTQFMFNPVRRGAQKLLSSPHALHAAVLAGFPDPSATDEGRVLWRLDSARNQAKLLIVSPGQPDLTHLAEQAGWPSLEDGWRTRPYQRVLGRIEVGHRYAFRLTANPTRSTRPVPGGRGKPFGHVTVSQQEEWLLNRQHRGGFRVDGDDDQKAVLIRDRKLITFRRREDSVTLRVVTYEGLLEVIDRDAFVATLTHGLGRAKGYGCGLMTIAAVS
ncbi:type I-E CRISPR-associated protein Cas6/Cse3/CasE [Microbacterium sp.]|uniref:type I-E CRISPR-associated protein Cas6/Cse3/CasE n=1 Tax=Microbacterium sp. TaxID=51671 RepID=UPI002811187F|nr:type I-E CRISPR-associated protein Cas6/Cse3/CasE [Microbacterium sp.]